MKSREWLRVHSLVMDTATDLSPVLELLRIEGDILVHAQSLL